MAFKRLHQNKLFTRPSLQYFAPQIHQQRKSRKIIYLPPSVRYKKSTLSTKKNKNFNIKFRGNSRKNGRNNTELKLKRSDFIS